MRSNLKKVKRRKRDIWYKVSVYTTFIGWAFFLIALIVSRYAAPEQDFGLLRYYGIDVRNNWLEPLTDYLYIILWISAISSYTTLVIDRVRGPKGEENKHFNTFLLLIITIIWVSYLIFDMHHNDSTAYITPVNSFINTTV